MLSTRMWDVFGPAGHGDVDEFRFSVWNTTLGMVPIAHLMERLQRAPRCNPPARRRSHICVRVHVCFPFRCWMRTTT